MNAKAEGDIESIRRYCLFNLFIQTEVQIPVSRYLDHVILLHIQNRRENILLLNEKNSSKIKYSLILRSVDTEYFDTLHLFQ